MVLFKKKDTKWTTDRFYLKIRRNKIRDLVIIAYLIAVASTIASFHFSIPIEGIEIKLDLGDLVFFIAVGLIKFSSLAWAAILVPIIDNTIHGHNWFATPFESGANFLALFIAAQILQRLKKSNKWGWKLLVGALLFCGVVPIKIIYNSLVAFILLYERGDGLESLLILIGLISVINCLKYGVIIYLTILVRADLKPWKLKQELSNTEN